MLIIASDLHLTDGTTCTNITADAFYLFTERIRDLAYRASWRMDGGYQPIEKIDVLLLGDVFDLLHSTRWAEGTPGPDNPVRPWDDPSDVGFHKTVEAITDGILLHNQKALSVLKHLSDPNTVRLSVNPKSSTGRKRVYQPVPVRIFYMLGNHDWYYYLPGEAYDVIRKKVIDATGISNPSEPFPFVPEELPELARTLQAHSVFARHGDCYDSFNFDKAHGRGASSLGDAVAVLLIDRFPAMVAAELGDQLPPEFITRMREIVNVRPILLVPTWIDSLVRRYCEPRLAKRVKAIWNDLASQFMHEPFVRGFDRRFQFDMVDGLEAILTITKATSFDMLSNLVSLIRQNFGASNVSFSKTAMKEKAYKDHVVDFMVFGHTHQQEVVPLNVYYQNDKQINQMLFNTGTWHALHTAAEARTRYVNFVSYYTMTIVAFFKDDERRGKPYETWTGTLGWE